MADTGRIVAALEAILVQYPGEKDLANGEAWLQANSQPPWLATGAYGRWRAVVGEGVVTFRLNPVSH